MATDLATEVVGDLLRQFGHPRGLNAPRTVDLDLPTSHEPARSRRHQLHSLTQAHRLTDVVGDEDNRKAGLLPDADELLVQDVARDRVKCGEGLIHQKNSCLLRECAGQRDPLAHPA